MKKLFLILILILNISQARTINPDTFVEDFRKMLPQMQKQIPKKINDEVSVIAIDMQDSTIIMNYEIYTIDPTNAIQRVKSDAKSFCLIASQVPHAKFIHNFYQNGMFLEEYIQDQYSCPLYN